MKYYIAYGSNLSVRQMAARCPEARVAGKAVLPDWKLVFRLHATIEPEKGSMVRVMIWEISDRDERHLDAYEGWPSYYIKQDIEVMMTDLRGKHPRKVTAMVYIMTEGHNVRMPMKGYVDVLAEGYERFGFDKDILRQALLEAKTIAEKEAEKYDLS
ncbi:MAG: gamma-glutamylcyclotransferase family protein [Eubacteriales bacterium]